MVKVVAIVLLFEGLFLVAGLWGNAGYLATFALTVRLSSSLPSEVKVALVLGSSCIGGLANGPVHVAQAVYFANAATALAHARADADGGASARALLSGLFALAFTGQEVLLKLLAGLPNTSMSIVFIAYSACGGACACLSLCLVLEPRPPEALRASAASGSTPLALEHESGGSQHNLASEDDLPAPGAFAVVHMLWRDRIARLAVLFGACFGYVGAFEGVVIATVRSHSKCVAAGTARNAWHLTHPPHLDRGSAA